ncbi:MULTISPECIES: shikimate 5-dehydrogenase [unclassified Brenneria]|uniref:shikimate 5-dehydrogenase n=1 Tax=unclassified Brenneria TaxID=2634434 RepID=UPI0015523A8C|nr:MULTISPECIES: shikimate 5-dehydrogenase [unclassified Brenneria]MBJ7222846.1 shikimate 5-dehydrogenase [Brenneria sp. L3-3C-1]MEE3644088.1 shikimate 5-dehydrogenase [Brenneria sp. L3_3C_1]MEE3651807.1 shikimate 5-dehydrogenase [Brenneria sp. HEZEL_4_2_4]NPD01766.1 shikimate 5-dehydrogenase [Brenneria sp. hezel4-2-4]
MGHEINKDTQLCMSLSGRPGNFGTRFHNYLYQELGLNFIYKAFTTKDIQAAVGGVRALGIRGCAVSMPFKEICIPFLDQLDTSAAVIESVNTIVNDDGFLRAYNTDYIAIAKLLDQYQVSPATTFALRGSGGMAKAVTAALHDAGFKNGYLIARNEASGKALASQYGYTWQPEVGDLPAEMIINVTPIGMAGGAESEQLAFEPAIIDAAKIVFDVVALPAETPLIRYGRQKGKQVITGAEVIVLQALEQFVLYTGVRPTDDQLTRAAAYARGEDVIK